MAFTLQGFGLVSTTMNTPITTLTSGVVTGVNNIFSYQSATDAQATISASGYFNSQAFTISTNDLVYAVGTDSNVWYQFTNTSGVITTTAFSLAGPVGTSNISANAVTYAKIQQASAGDVLLANPTGSAANYEEITLANTLAFSGTTLQVAPAVYQYATGSLTLANLTGMYAAPVQILAASVAGSGKAIIVDKFLLNTTYGSAAFTAGGVMLLQYGNTADGAGTAATSTVAASVLTGLTANGMISFSGAALGGISSAAINAGIYISNQTQAFATGTGGSATYQIWYKVVSLS